MNHPLVSILCLSYNQSRFILESLESIKSQTYNHYELIICDDASKDNSAEIIEKWLETNPSITSKFIKHKENAGICKSLNEVFSHAKGKYIQMLALDDILLKDKLERHVSILENSKESDALVFSDAFLIDDDSQLLGNMFIAYHLKYLKIESGNFYQKLLNQNFIPAMSTLVKTDLIRIENSWDENLSYEDYDMWLRLSRKYNFIFDSTPSCKYRFHENNTHKKKGFFDDSIFNIYLKHFEEPIAKAKLYTILERKYLSKELKDEHQRFFKLYKAETIPQKLIKNKIPVFVYKVLKISQKFFSI